MLPSRKSRGRLAAALVAFSALTVVLPAPAAVAESRAVTTSEVSFTGANGVVLHGSVLKPTKPGPTHAAVVLQGGSNWKERSDLKLQADMFASLGVVTLVYDRRTVGYSQTMRDYGVLADDLLAAVDTLRERDGVDPANVGVWGVSEGGWVAPLAASRSTHVAFVITVGASGLGGARQTSWYWQNLLRHEGVDSSMNRALSYTGTRFAVASGLFPEADYDPVPVLRRLRQPILAMWGEFDINHPASESADIFAHALAAGGNSRYSLRVVPGGGPDLEQTTDAGFDKLDSLAPAYRGLVGGWLAAIPAHPVVDRMYPQARQTGVLPPLAWYESLWVEGIAFLLFILGFAGYPLFAVVARARGRRLTVIPAARWSALTGGIAVAGFVGYFGLMQASGMRDLGPIVFGRPIPWLALQLLGVGVIVLTVLSGRSWLRTHRGLAGASRARLLLLTVAGVAFVPWALYWGLLLP